MVKGQAQVEYVYPDEAFSETEVVEYKATEATSPLQFFDGGIPAALKKAKEERKLVFVDFYADWCKPCKVIEKEAFTDPVFYTYVNQNYVVVKIFGDNFDNGDMKYAEDMGVSIYPTLMVLNSRGEEMGRVTGYNTAYTYVNELKRIERYSAYKR